MAQVFTSIVNKIRGWTSRKPGPSREAISRLFRFKYTCFKDLLASNTELLNILADFEEKLRGQEVFGMAYIRSQATRAVFHTLRMVKSLDDLAGHKYGLLFEALDQVNQEIKNELGRRKELPLTAFVLPYSEITKEMVDWVGGKNANLGELLNRAKLAIPEGFAITTRAYEFFLEKNSLVDEINRMRMDLDINDPNAVNEVSEEIQRLIIKAKVPVELEEAILSAYESLSKKLMGKKPAVALRSSAIGEDSELSYAGQYLSVLNVPHDRIVDTYKYVIASLYTPRAISYRLNKGMRDEDIAMSVACIEMVESVVSGVAYSRHPFNMLDEKVVINAVCGLGPYAVDGIVAPDSYLVSKDKDLHIADINIAHKPIQLVANTGGGLSEVEVSLDRQDKACLTKEQIKTLAEYAVRLENHYQYPQDIEWALDPSGRLLILQTRPLHIEDTGRDGGRDFPVVEGYPILLTGGAIAFPGIGNGPAFHVTCDEDLVNFPEGAVLVAKHSTPQFVIVMKKTAAIVTDAGSVTGHMASLAREFGVPAVLDTKTATAAIQDGAEITVDAYSGRVYLGKVPELIALEKRRESAMKDTPVYQTLRKVADLIVPLHLVDPKAASFSAANCKTLHDIMRFAHELSYKEMFQISDIVSDTGGGGAVKLRASTLLDLHIIDLGDGLKDVAPDDQWVSRSQIISVPLKALLGGMLSEDLRNSGPRPIDLGGFFSVMREQMLSPDTSSERFGDRSYAIASDTYVNFSSRIGYHYSVLDAYCSDSVNKNYITFSFKGGAADEIRRNRRVRAIARILEALGFSVDTREDRVDARLYKYEQSVIEERLDKVGRLLQFTRQMDMLMRSESSVEFVAKNFLEGNYHFDPELLGQEQKTDSE
jgi:pyruvate,water dikinase